jgi:hypothetical protein
VKWNREPNTNCILPTSLDHKLYGGDSGSFTLAFSRDGTRLAAVCGNKSEFSIKIFTIRPKVRAKVAEGEC